MDDQLPQAEGTVLRMGSDLSPGTLWRQLEHRHVLLSQSEEAFQSRFERLLAILKLLGPDVLVEGGQRRAGLGQDLAVTQAINHLAIGQVGDDLFGRPLVWYRTGCCLPRCHGSGKLLQSARRGGKNRKRLGIGLGMIFTANGANHGLIPPGAVSGSCVLRKRFAVGPRSLPGWHRPRRRPRWGARDSHRLSPLPPRLPALAPLDSRHGGDAIPPVVADSRIGCHDISNLHNNPPVQIFSFDKTPPPLPPW